MKHSRPLVGGAVSPPCTASSAYRSFVRVTGEAFDADQIGWSCDGLLEIPALSADELARFCGKVEARGPNDCWPWRGEVDKHGRGRFCARGTRFKAPRVAWAIANGRSPTANICHTCDDPGCVNPAHLWEGTQLENMRDASSKGKWLHMRRETCKHGHPLNGTNVYVRPDGLGRMCRACGLARTRKRRAAR